MATTLNNAGIYVGGYELSSYFNSIDLSGEADVLDVTAFGAGAREYLIGFKGARFAAGGWYHPTGSDAPLFDAWGTTDTIVSLVTANTAGGVAYFVRGCATTVGYGLPLGQAATIQMSGQTSTAPLVRGNMLHRGSAVTSTSNSTPQQIGAVTSAQRIFAAAHVFSVAGTDTPTITFKVQSDDSSGFSSATDRLTFTGMTAIGAQWQEAGPSAITDDYWRVNFAISGTNPVFSFAVMFGILDDIL